jgi:hypothetical protein
MSSNFYAGKSSRALRAKPFLNDEANSKWGAFMQFARMMAWGLDVWDWSMLLGGSLLVAFEALLV